MYNSERDSSKILSKSDSFILITMTISLRISTENGINCLDITRLLSKNRIQAEVIPHYASTEEGTVEYGCTINMFKLDQKDFVEKVWDPLNNILDINCGFVETSQYKGCVSDWPNVMIKSNCNPSIIDLSI